MNRLMRAATALATAVGIAACTPLSPTPLVEGHPLALTPPQGWEEQPVPETEAAAKDPIIYTARPAEGGDAALLVQVFPGQVSTIQTGVSLAEAGREARWRDYESDPPTELTVAGADAARRIDYTYSCDDSGGDCAGTVFVLLQERDLYLVRLSWQDDLVSPREAEGLQDSLALVP